MLNSVNLKTVAFERTSLRETLLAKVALVRPDTSVRARVPFKVEGVVETLSAESTQITFDITVTFHVTVQQSLQAESLVADTTAKSAWIVVLQILRERYDFCC